MSGDDLTGDLTGLSNYARVSGASDPSVSPQKPFSSFDFLSSTPSNLLYRQLTKHATQGMRLVADSTPYSLLNQPMYLKMYSNVNSNKNIKNFALNKHIYPNTFSGSSITSPEAKPSCLSYRPDKTVGNDQYAKIKTVKRRRTDCRCCKTLCDCCGDLISEGIFTLSDSEDEGIYNMENPQSQSRKLMLENLKVGKLANGQKAMSRDELSQILTKDGFDFLKPAFICKVINML